MSHSWSLRDGDWLADWPARVARHDLVYLSPPDDPMQGLPIGNGDFGALLWVDGRRVILSLNKVDTFDDGPAEHFHGWAGASEEKQTSLRSCGRLILDFGLPVWDEEYLQDFKGGLKLAGAEAHLRGESPFGSCSVRAYASQSAQVLVVRAEMSGAEDVAHSIILERFGSRSFGHWYSQINRDPSLGLDGTQCSIQRDRIVIHQQLRELSFVVVAAIVPDGGAIVQVDQLHSRAARFQTARRRTIGYTIYVTAVTSENAADPLVEAHARLDAAIKAGEAELARRHAEDWKRFWLRSFVHLSDDYVANIWHLTLYLAAASCRGAYPPHFCKGLWGHSHDFTPWYFYFHWNTQWAYWQLHPAGADELMKPYFEFRFRQLANATDYARLTHGTPGALYADVSNRRGFQDLDTKENHTPGPQIAMEFWRHFEFTGDRTFLRERAWPVMRAVADWYLHTIQRDEDGQFHPLPGTVYESNVSMRDPITDLAMIRRLFPAVIKALAILEDASLDAAKLRNVLDQLAPFYLLELEANEIRDQDGRVIHNGGLGDASEVLTRKAFAVGYDPQARKWMRSRIAGKPPGYYGIPDAEFVPVFPGEIVGLKDRGRNELYDAAVTQLRLHPSDAHRAAPANDDDDPFDGLCMGWCPVPIVCARLGLKQHMADTLHDQIKLWQLYPQGFGHYGPHGVNLRDRNQFYHLHPARDAADTSKTVPISGWRFRHFSNEAMPIVSTAVNEMLLQSHEDAIRICPALPAEWSATFTLYARGGFKISAQATKGVVDWIWIESTRGGPLRLFVPWVDAREIYLWQRGAGDGQFATEPTRAVNCDKGRIVEWATLPGGIYLVGADARLVADWSEAPLPLAANEKPKTLGGAILGKHRQF